MSGESSVGVEVESRDGLDVESREGMDVSPCMGKDVSPLVGLGVEARDGEEDWHVEEQPAMAVLRDGEEKRHVGLGEDVALGVQPRVCLGEDESKGMEEAISEQLVFVQDSDEVEESMCMDDPSSKQEMAAQDSDEVKFVMDSLASDTVVPDSQVEDVTVLEKNIHCTGESFNKIEIEVASALMQLHGTEVSRFQFDREAHHVSNLILPVMFPGWYG